MHAFDFILVLFSFVYAAAVTQLLSTAGEIIIASKRIRVSWLTRDAPDRSGASPRGQCSPSTGFPARRIQCGLDVGRAAVHVRVVDRPVGFARGTVLGCRVDRLLFLDGGGHLSERTSRLTAHPANRRDRPTALSFRGEPKISHRLHNSLRDHGGDQCQAWPSAGALQWPAQNIVIVPMTIASGVAAIFINSHWVDSNRGLDLVLCRIADVVIRMISGARRTRIHWRDQSEADSQQHAWPAKKNDQRIKKGHRDRDLGDQW